MKVKSRIVEAANRVWKAFMRYGPVDDGRPEGDEFDAALMDLRLVAKGRMYQTDAERAALVVVVNALDDVGGDPVHWKVREAIEAARKILNCSDLEVEE